MSDGPRSSKRIGDMNGWSPVLFRLLLISQPVVMAAGITLGTWLVSSINELSQQQAVIGEKLDQVTTRHYTHDAARADHLQLRQSIIDEVFEKLPPPYLLRQVDAVEKRVERLEGQQP